MQLSTVVRSEITSGVAVDRRFAQPRRHAVESSRRRRFARIAVALSLLAALLPATGAVASTRLAPEHLAVGHGVFWESPPTTGGGAGVPDVAQVDPDAACRMTTCIDYPVSLPAGGHRLRVGADWQTLDENWRIVIKDPSGNTVQNETGQFSAEAFVDDPAPGHWLIRIVPTYVLTSQVVHLRAKLEAAPPALREAKDMLPNLRLDPPFEFSLAGENGNCQDAERQNYGAKRCLRFSTGPMNMGDGKLDLRLRPDGPGAMTGTTWQRIHRTDGSVRERAAGPFVFHQQHMHFHHAGVAGFTAYRVDDPRSGKLTKIGVSPKQGYCMGDYLITDWDHFVSEASRDFYAGDYGDNCGLTGLGVPGAPFTGADIGLSTGWADIYSYFIPDNFVEFSAAEDGLYLITGTTDPDNTLLEKDETDNTSYSLIRVAGDCVSLVERGYGRSPWDRDKEISTDYRQGQAPGQCSAA